MQLDEKAVRGVFKLLESSPMRTPIARSAAVPSRTTFEISLEDCVAGMSKLPTGCVDLVVTSPPYNLGIKYRVYKDDQERGRYLDWCKRWGGEIRRVLKEDGSFFLNVGSSPSSPMLPHELAGLFGRGLFSLQNTIHWIKSITIGGDDGEEPLSRGHFKPISSPRYLNDCHEYIFHFTKEGKTRIDRLAIGVPYSDKSNISRWGHTEGQDKRCRGNTWFIPYRTIQNRKAERPHPASFPAELTRNCILLHAHGREGELTMMDPFLGIGSSAVAAQELQVGHFIGFEIDEAYLGVALERLGITDPRVCPTQTELRTRQNRKKSSENPLRVI